MTWEVNFFWVATTLYGLAGSLALFGYIFKKDKLLDLSIWVGTVGLIPHALSILLRWNRVGHAPYINMYEVMSSDAFISLIFFLLIQWKYKFLRKASFIVFFVIFLAMGLGLISTKEDIPLPPSLKSYWLILHVGFAKLCIASFLIAFSIAILYLYKSSKPETEFSKKLPSLQTLDILIYRFNAIGFAFYTIKIIAGSIWANYAWGRYWGFDPVETWSLITWFAYGMYFHLRLNKNWTGKRSSLLTVIIFTLAILSFFFIPYFLKTLHSEYLVK